MIFNNIFSLTHDQYRLERKSRQLRDKLDDRALRGKKTQRLQAKMNLNDRKIKARYKDKASDEQFKEKHDEMKNRQREKLQRKLEKAERRVDTSRDLYHRSLGLEKLWTAPNRLIQTARLARTRRKLDNLGDS